MKSVLVWGVGEAQKFLPLEMGKVKRDPNGIDAAYPIRFSSEQLGGEQMHSKDALAKLEMRDSPAQNKMSSWS